MSGNLSAGAEKKTSGRCDCYNFNPAQGLRVQLATLWVQSQTFFSSWYTSSQQVPTLSTARLAAMLLSSWHAAAIARSYEVASPVYCPYTHHVCACAQVLRERLLTEAESSVQLNAEVASRWGYLFRLEVPQELHQQMLSQQAACDKIIASKDEIVAAMRTQLHEKDDEYVRMLKQQGEDVDQLLLNMGKQLDEMQTAYRNELAQIDEAYMQVCVHTNWATQRELLY